MSGGMKKLGRLIDRWNKAMRRTLLEKPAPPKDPKLRRALDEYSRIAGKFGIGSKEEKEARKRLAKEVPGFDVAARGLIMCAISLKYDLLKAWEREHGKK